MALTDQDITAANQRGATLQRATPQALAARYDRRISRIVIALSSGIEIALRPNKVQGLEHAQAEALREIEISPSGMGLHFPQLDADIYLPALLDGYLGSRTWRAAAMGQRGGQVRSEAKAAAARENGLRGGRPRKAADPMTP